MRPNLLFLVGYMGCGKTSLGRKVAARLGWDFVDTDQEVERRESATVNEIFSYAGEEYFRRCERSVLDAAIADGRPKVVSTGGGLPTYRDNMERMNAAGMTVYLRRSAEKIASRLSPYGRAKRPKLRGLNDEELVEFMTRNMAERAPRYEQAQLMLDGDRLSDAEMIERIRIRMNGHE